MKWVAVELHSSESSMPSNNKGIKKMNVKWEQDEVLMILTLISTTGVMSKLLRDKILHRMK